MTAITKTVSVPASAHVSPSTPATENVILVFKDGQIIKAWQNGVEARGKRHFSTIDVHHRDYGPSYWADYAMKELKLTISDIVMRCVAEKVKFF